MSWELIDFLKEINFAPLWQFIKTWWWLPLPFIFWKFFAFLWLWWRRYHVYFPKLKYVLLEIRIPREIKKPIKAMEVVFSNLWPLYRGINFKDKWWVGRVHLSLSFEIVSIGGSTHFFIRTPDYFRNVVESAIYSQYPEVEIFAVDDYTKYVPQDIPNKEWDLYGYDYQLIKEDPYPIKTHPYISVKKDEDIPEEKRIDPISNLLEGMAKMEPGEQLWIQIIAKPITNKENNWVTRGEKIINKIIGRKGPTKPKPILWEVLDFLISGPPKPPEKAEREEVPTKLEYLTPGEIEIVKGIEEKISKQGFETNIRFIYLGKREVFSKHKIILPISYFNSFSTQNLNSLKPWGRTKTKIEYILIKRRTYLRKRRIFYRYVIRETPLYPRSGGTFALNTEELASLYHFPGREVTAAPFVPRIEAKKGEAPPTLPVE